MFGLSMSVFWYALLAISLLVIAGYSVSFLASRISIETAAVPEGSREVSERAPEGKGEAVRCEYCGHIIRRTA